MKSDTHLSVRFEAIFACHTLSFDYVDLQFACAFEEWKQKETTQVEDAENDAIIVKEKKLVDKFLIKSGMLRFSFLLECAPPGAIPDPQLVAAMLELVGFELVNMLIRTGVTIHVSYQ